MGPNDLALNCGTGAGGFQPGNSCGGGEGGGGGGYEDDGTIGGGDPRSRQDAANEDDDGTIGGGDPRNRKTGDGTGQDDDDAADRDRADKEVRDSAKAVEDAKQAIRDAEDSHTKRLQSMKDDHAAKVKRLEEVSKRLEELKKKRDASTAKIEELRSRMKPGKRGEGAAKFPVWDDKGRLNYTTDAAESKRQIDERNKKFSRPYDLVFSVPGSEGGFLAGSRRDANGVPVKTFVKGLIKIGDWTVPGMKDKLKVNLARLERWRDVSNEMVANGVRIPVPVGHTDDPEKNRGWARDFFVEDGWLKASLDLIGEDAILLGSRTEVSIYVPESVTDGKGNVYEQPIAHVALTPTPVISGQDGFVPIAASRNAYLARPSAETDMAFDSKTFLASMVALAGLNLAQDVSEEDQAAQVEKYVKGMKDGCAKKTEELKASLSLARREADELRAKAGNVDPEPHPEVIELSRENRTNAFDGLVARGRISPRAADRFKAAFIGENGSALKLSLTGPGRSLYREVIAALEENDPKDLQERTRAQVPEGVLLSRPNAAGAGVDPDLKSRQHSAYGKEAPAAAN